MRDARSAPGRVSPASLLEVVRQATARAHGDLESRLDLEGDAWTTPRYIAFLRATLSVVQAVEHDITRQLRTIDPTFEGECGSARLTHDLGRLGASDRVDAVAIAPPIDTAAQALGAAYVLRGSMLGGQIIARTLQDRLRLDRDCFTYLRPDGAAAGESWRAFTTRLNAFGHTASAADWDEAAETARALFRAFDAAFTDEDFA